VADRDKNLDMAPSSAPPRPYVEAIAERFKGSLKLTE
jgi:hypothetical protein